MPGTITPVAPKNTTVNKPVAKAPVPAGFTISDLAEQLRTEENGLKLRLGTVDATGLAGNLVAVRIAGSTQASLANFVNYVPNVGDTVLVLQNDEDFIIIGKPGSIGSSTQVFNVQDFGAIGDGVHDDTPNIQACIDAAPAGSFIYFPNGEYSTGTINITKQLHLLGDGRFTSWLTANAAAITGLVRYDIPNPTTTVRNVYGPTFVGIGINLLPQPTAIGIYTSPTVSWFHAVDFYVEGGANSVYNQGTNSKFELFRVIDPSDSFFKVDGDTGMELTLSLGDGTRFRTGTTNWAIDIVGTLSSGNGGDLRLENVAFNCGLGGAILAGGVRLQYPGLVSIPIFTNKVVIDNCSGPSWRFVNVADVTLEGSWCNSAAGTTAAIEIYGGRNLKFFGNDYFGGNATYEFLGTTACSGFTSRDNNCPTGPLYKITGSGKPTDIRIDDYAPGATVWAQITNDIPWLKTHQAKRWSAELLEPGTIILQEDAHFVGNTGEPVFQNGWANNSASPLYFTKDAQGRVTIVGQINSGTQTTVCALPGEVWPFFQKYAATVRGTGSSVTMVTCGVSPSGVLTIEKTEAAGTAAADYIVNISYLAGG